MAAVVTNQGAPTTLRTFVALDLPQPVQAAIAVAQDHLRESIRGAGLAAAVRWSDVRGMHLTLRFLGETTPSQCETVVAGLHHVTQTVSPFSLTLGALGVFPKPAQPRVLWIGLGGDLAALTALQRAVETLAQAAGFAAETKPFAPHITLARGRREADRQTVAALGRTLAAVPPPPLPAVTVTVDHVTHYRSDLRPSGAVYTPLAVVPLRDTR